MSIAKYLAKLAQSVTSQGILNSTAVQGGGGGTTPTVTAVGYPGNDTAVNTSGGDTVTLTGTNFNTGVTVVINGTPASVITRVSATQLTFTAPAQATGNYIIYVVNTDGSTALAVPGLQYSPFPTWTTAAGSLGNPNVNVSFTSTLATTGDAPITYSLYSGTLPSGITLNSSTGVLSGTTANLGSSTTYNFTIRATDAQNQDTDRAFSITISPVVIGQVEYTTVGTYTWTAPAGVNSVSVVAVGGGGGSTGGSGGGGLGWKNNISVTPGTGYTVEVGRGGNAFNVRTGAVSYFISTGTVAGYGGGLPPAHQYGVEVDGFGGGYVGDGGGNGGYGGAYPGGAYNNNPYAGCGGAGGYSGNGGNGATAGSNNGSAGNGGGGGGGGSNGTSFPGSGGGVGIYGQGANGTFGQAGSGGYTGGGGGGSGGGTGATPLYGGGGSNTSAANSNAGAVRIIWGSGRSFPSTLTTNQ